jgi:hypothetical protein
VKIPQFIHTLRKVSEDNAPAILTGFGIAGTLATAYLAGDASFKAARLIDEAQRIENEQEKSHPLDKKEKFKLTWSLYLPAAGAGCATVGCIYFANRISSKRLAALAAAYTIAEKANSEYKEKVLEMLGKDKEEKVRASVQQDRIDRDPDLDGMIDSEMEDGRVRCKDAWSGRYFRSTMEEIKEAQNNVNYQILNNQYASLTDFYTQLCLEKTKESDDVGWNSDKMMEITFTSAIDSKKRPVLVMDFAVAPIRSYWKGNV